MHVSPRSRMRAFSATTDMVAEGKRGGEHCGHSNGNFFYTWDLVIHYHYIVK